MEGLTDEKGGEAERARSGEGCAGGPQGGQQDVAFGRKGPAGNEEENGSGEWLCGERRVGAVWGLCTFGGHLGEGESETKREGQRGVYVAERLKGSDR